MELRALALELLALQEPAAKAQAVRDAVSAAHISSLSPQADLHRAAAALTLPGRPARPALVPPKQVPSRTPFTPEGRAALLHAIAHIEFNAINLALDAIWRFAGLPEAYYRDWWQVAQEEALHFQLLAAHLKRLNCSYGDYEAHDGLWAMCEKTAGSAIARMALVPRTLEARGLDATPPLQAKFKKAGDDEAVRILEVILRDEVGHVAIGNHWYRWLCAQQGLDPVALYPQLSQQYGAPRLRAPFNLDARRVAGFTEHELDDLLSHADGAAHARP